MRLLITIVLLVQTSIYAQETENASNMIDDKIKTMIAVSGAKTAFNKAADTMLENQKEALEAIDSKLFELFKEEIKIVGENKLDSLLVPVYKKYLNEKEIDDIIEFYSSESGKSLVSKYPLIMEESISVGSEWGILLGEDILNKLNKINSKNFNKEIDEDCSRFKKGKFISYDMGIEIEMERTNKIQKEYYYDGVEHFEIVWIANNRYTLKPKKKNTEFGDGFLIVNIYEVDGDAYKYTAKYQDIDYYVSGNVTKVD